MKIADIRCYSIKMEKKNQFIVVVETDEGILGLGEGGLSTRDLAMQGAVDHYRQWLIGRDPFDIGALWQEMYRSQYFEGGRALSAAISALDIALYDIKAKALGVPVHELLGGRHRDWIDGFCTVSGRTFQEFLTSIRSRLDEGWPAIRCGMAGRTDETGLFEPRESIPVTADWMTRARAEIGGALVLGVEYHHRLSVAEAASFCQRMPRGTLDFLEEPIRDECPAAYAELRKLTDIPFAIGEEFSSKWQFLPYVERGLTNFCRLDICNVGGFTEAMKVAGWCEAHYIDLMPHNPLGPINTAAILHLAAACPNFAWMEINVSRSSEHLDRELFPVQPEMEGVRYRLPTDPGLGVTLDEEVARARGFEWTEFPHLRMRDGSHTNW